MEVHRDSYVYRTRFDIPANVPVNVQEIDPEGDPGLLDFGVDAYCSVCGPASGAQPRSELWAVRQKTTDQLAGPVWKYCREHLPDREWQPGGVNSRGSRISESTCMDCFIIVPTGSICDVTGKPHVGR